MLIDYSKNVTGSMSATEQESIENSISTIACTPYGAAPYIRSMGIKNYPPDSDSEIEKNKYATEVITQCSIWENRAKVSEVGFTGDGKVRMVIENGC